MCTSTKKQSNKYFSNFTNLSTKVCEIVQNYTDNMINDKTFDNKKSPYNYFILMQNFIKLQIMPWLVWFISIIRSLIYDYTIGMFYTRYLTKDTFNSFPEGSRILDVGIGTGYGYRLNQETIRQKNLHIVGVDTDIDYITRAQQVMNSTGLTNHVKLIHNDIRKLEDPHNNNEKYDYVMFSDCYAVISDVHEVIRSTERFLKPTGKIVVISTLFEKYYSQLDWIKRRVHKVTTVHLGKMMLKKDLLDFAVTRVKDNNINFVKITKISVPYTDYFWGSYRVEWNPNTDTSNVTTKSKKRI